mmetsp:Transcript_77619/g.180020  ORF Transcript_77619/g.180020 Transcript_77619/m.180020 type:complete len:233 (-) Transcript_77619:3-701(-)
MNAGVPTLSTSNTPGFFLAAMPKSANFTFASLLSALPPANMMFWGFMSRWHMFLSCKYSMPSNICCIMPTTITSPSLPSHSLAASSKLPPSQNSRTMKKMPFVSTKSTSCTNLSFPLHSRMNSTSEKIRLEGTSNWNIFCLLSSFTAAGAPPLFSFARQTVPKDPCPSGPLDRLISQTSSTRRNFPPAVPVVVVCVEASCPISAPGAGRVFLQLSLLTGCPESPPPRVAKTA